MRGRLSAPSWSPNGRKLAFVRVHTYERKGLSHPEFDIYVSRLDGSRLRNLTPGKDRFEWGFDPDWSPDGRRIAYARGDEGCGSIFVMRANGRKDKRVTPDGCGDYQHRSPEWSPQGGAIAYAALHDTAECGGPDELRIERLGSEDDVTLVSQCSAGIRNVSWQRL